MNHIPRHWRAHVRLEGLPIDHVNRSIEQTGNVIFQSDVVEKRDMSLGIDINENVEIAVRSALAARDRPEYRGMRDAARPQRAFMAAQGGKGILSIHTQIIPQSAVGGRASNLYCDRYCPVTCSPHER